MFISFFSTIGPFNGIKVYLRKIEYSLTELGKSLETILSELCKRGGNYAKL
ncbi:winged helix-turn-helix transcriptional regulator [Neobacillus massiliamazoniensis]|uniref:winged helix-turn-helix transcriptional regulator n=1 Tax=Neobacillus massiliamazoniensis TaxID=1499688 RepID=UPI000B8A57F2